MAKAPTKPWNADPKYGGMSDLAASRSHEAAQLQNSRAHKTGLSRQDTTASNYRGTSALVDSGGRPLGKLGLQFRKFSEIEPAAESRYLVKDVIPREGLVVVWGPPKSGKSFWVLDLMTHVAAGRVYRGRRVQQRPVIYFAFEGHEGVRARIKAIRLQSNWDDIPLFLCGDRLALPTDSVSLIAEIRMKLLDVEPGIVVLDTLNRSIEGSENDPSDMGGYIRAADQIRAAFGCAVIVVHHCGVDGSRPRGHTSLTAAADAQISVSKRRSEIVATVQYMKDGSEGGVIQSCLEAITVGEDTDGEPITSCVIRDVCDGLVETKPRITGRTAFVFGVLMAMVSECLSGKTEIPTLIATKLWRDRCVSEMGPATSKASRQKAFARAYNALLKAERITETGEHVCPL